MSLEYIFWRFHWFPSVISVSYGGSTGTIALIQLFVVAQLERADLLAFRLCCFTLYCLDFWDHFPHGVIGRKWNWIVSVPDHCLLIYTSVTAVFRDSSTCTIMSIHLVVAQLVSSSQFSWRLLWYSSVIRVSSGGYTCTRVIAVSLGGSYGTLRA